MSDRLTELVEYLLLLLVRWNQKRRKSMRVLCVLNAIANPRTKSCLLHVVCQSWRRNSSLLVWGQRSSTHGRSGRGASDGAGVAGGIAGTLFLLIAIRPAPEPKKHQEEKDAAADGATDDRPRGFRAPVWIV